MSDMQKNVSDAARATALLAEAEFHFSRALGQNFLLDDAWNARIAEIAGAGTDANILEIGPGAGTLTCALARAGARVLAVEIDQGLRGILEKMLAPFPEAQVVYGDILKQEIPKLIDSRFGEGTDWELVSNLPYSIAADLLPRVACGARRPRIIVAMVQKEAADRMCARPGTKTWCALAAKMQYYYHMEIVAALPPHAFIPNAHVESALIRCDRYAQEEKPAQPEDEETFLRCIDAAFAMRRKTYANNLSGAFSIGKDKAAQILRACGLSETARGETLTLEEIAKVAGSL